MKMQWHQERDQGLAQEILFLFSVLNGFLSDKVRTG